VGLDKGFRVRFHHRCSGSRGLTCTEVVGEVDFPGAMIEFGLICARWCAHCGAGFLPPECIAKFEDTLAHEDLKDNGDGVGVGLTNIEK
jgi:hypothetical protein